MRDGRMRGVGWCGVLLGVLACDGNGAVDGPPDASVPDAVAQVILTACDTVGQTGCPTGYKCTVYDTGPGPSVPACVRVTGYLIEGSLCQSGHTGLDDCAPALVCGLSTLTATTMCLRLCTATGGCGPGQECFGAFVSGQGVCYASGCAIFDPASCPPGTTCDVRVKVEGTSLGDVCRIVGSLTVGAGCTTPIACVAGSTCDQPSGPEFACYAFCDATHACASGTCHTGQFSPDIGICF